MILRSIVFLALAFSTAPIVSAAIIGTNTPSQPITMERIAVLPFTQRSAWENYLKASQKQMQADQDFFNAEMKAHGIKQSTNAPYARSFGGIALNKSASWYGETDGRHIADVIVSFQTPAGGWSKRLDMTHNERVPGERFTADNDSRFLTNSTADLDQPVDRNWSYVGTFDNDATTTQLRYLAKVIAALPPDDSVKYRASFLSGLNYIFRSQFPNGGWPQVWPLQGGYHDGVTFNDGGLLHALELLNDVAGGTNEFSFVPQKIRAQATASVKRGIECILATQIIVDKRRTVWCQQHDPLTLKPTSARNYEMPSEGAAESAGIMLFLMKLPHPDKQITAAVNAAAAWFKKTAIYGYAFKFTTLEGRQLISSPGSGPLWARYYEIGTDRPIFGDRDKTIHDQVREISAERRKGYSWYGDAPRQALQRYELWQKPPVKKAAKKTRN